MVLDYQVSCQKKAFRIKDLEKKKVLYNQGLSAAKRTRAKRGMVLKYFYGHIKIFNGVGADFTIARYGLSMVRMYY